MNVQKTTSGPPRGSFAYTDSSAHLSLGNATFTSLTITGQHAEFKGMAQTASHTTVNFTVDVNDNGPGPKDTFAITLNTGYSASGNLMTGNIQVH